MRRSLGRNTAIAEGVSGAATLSPKQFGLSQASRMWISRGWQQPWNRRTCCADRGGFRIRIFLRKKKLVVHRDAWLLGVRIRRRFRRCRTEPSGELRILSSWRRLRVAFPGLSSHLLTFELLSQLTFESFLFSRLHVVGVFLDFLDDAFLLNLSLEAPKGALNGLTFEHPNFGQSMPPQYMRSSREYVVPSVTKQHVFLRCSGPPPRIAVNTTKVGYHKR